MGSWSSVSKPKDPTTRLGVYKSIGDVADNHRLRNYEREYEERDVWGEWTGQRDIAESTAKRVERTEDSWKASMRKQGRHHALAAPTHVVQWADELLERMSIGTFANRYYSEVYHFYDWLLWQWDEPHQYNPALMATQDSQAVAHAYYERITLGYPDDYDHGWEP